MNLAAMSIVKLYGLDSRLRERMGMALYASATEMQTQTMHGLVGIAKATTIETEDVQIVGVDQDTNQPLVTSRQLPLPVVKRGMDNVHAGMSTPEAIGYEWNADTPENGMLGWITLLDPNEKVVVGL